MSAVLSLRAWREQRFLDLAAEFDLTLAEAREEAPSWMVSEHAWWEYVLASVTAGADLSTTQIRGLSEEQWQALRRSPRLLADDALRGDWARAREGWTARERRQFVRPRGEAERRADAADAVHRLRQEQARRARRDREVRDLMQPGYGR